MSALGGRPSVFSAQSRKSIFSVNNQIAPGHSITPVEDQEHEEESEENRSGSSAASNRPQSNFIWFIIKCVT